MSSVIQIRLIDGITYGNEVKLKQQWQQRFPFETCSSGIFLHIMSPTNKADGLCNPNWIDRQYHIC